MAVCRAGESLAMSTFMVVNAARRVPHDSGWGYLAVVAICMSGILPVHQNTRETAKE